MVEDKQMSHEGITKDEEDEGQHLEVVLAYNKSELRLLEKWLEEPNIHTEVAKDEGKEEFHILRSGVESRLRGSPFRKDKNEEMDMDESQGNEDRRQPSKEGQDMGSSING